MIGCGSHSPAQSNKRKEEEGRRGKLAATEERKKDGEVNSPLRKRGRRTEVNSPVLKRGRRTAR
jgi:hypothetical protein